MNQGDIVWVTFPAGAGRVQSGRRPAVIVQNDETSKQTATILVVLLTTQKEALRFPGTVLIDPDHENRLPQPSVALVFQLAAIDQKHLESRQGSVAKSTLDSLLGALTDITEQ